MFNALNIFYNTRKTPDFSGFPVILPNPNRITKPKQSATSLVALFCVDAARQELALVRDGAAQKNAAASAEALCFDFDDGPRRKGKRSAAT